MEHRNTFTIGDESRGYIIRRINIACLQEKNEVGKIQDIDMVHRKGKVRKRGENNN